MIFTNTKIEVAGLAFAALIFCTIVVLLWAMRPSPADDLEDAYLDDLIARRGTPSWRRGRGAYDSIYMCNCTRPDMRGGRTTSSGQPACLQCGGVL